LTAQAHQRTLTPRRAGRARVTPARGVDRRNDGLERPCPSRPPTTPLIQGSPRLELRERIWTYAELYPRSLTTVVIETNNGGRSGARY